MKKIFALMTIALLAMTSFSLQSCDDDNDDYVPTTYAVVTVKPNADNSSFVMQLNDSVQIMASNMVTSPFGTKEKRALIGFTAADGQQTEGELTRVKVLWMDSILTKPVARDLGEEANKETYGDEPIEVVNSWETVAEDGYINLRFRGYWGDLKKAHTINLVHRTDANRPYLLQLYHDNKGDEGTVVADGLVGFRLPEAFNESDEPITITLQYESYSGKLKTVAFKYIPRKD